ncbi:putative S-adenosyl-L-methionine-dependent methyltransferase-domain-containing protein [Coniochaeta sp. 2T2.1]|nr:putative S-adenosyl-L-methionine-dependent methyltransferase-domain-containing protein [Coniochaeta sp. 2T2.1]
MRSIVPRLTRAALHSSIRARPASLAALRASSYHGLRIRSYSDKAAADNPATEKPVNTFEDEPERKWSTPLAKQLADAIGATGPVPLASYMRMCLTSDTGGYYTGAIEEGRDQFGLKGDFVTSPEISQVFGELIGIWFLTEWLAQGKPKKGVELIEVGPGRGTLMADVVRTINQFPAMANSIDAIYMVEASPKLRMAQKDLLCGKDAPMTESNVGYHSVCKSTHLPIVWTETIKSIPSAADKTPFIVAHEFFDALPIHAFQCVSVAPAEPPSSASPSTRTSQPTLQWREMLVSPTPESSTHESLHTPPSQSRSGPPPDFQMTLANTSTRHSRYLPETSPRYRAIKSKVGPGAVIEVCPDANLYASDFASRIGGSAARPKSRPSGAALILDYGPGDGSVPINSLRGIKAHQRVSPFAEPGLVDLSVDVDFTGIAESAMNASEGVEVHGPVEQGVFLEGMGIRERVEVLMKGCKDEQSRKAVETAWRRLVDRGPGGMGKVYKALAILPENEGRRRPVGFGGDVQA